MVVSEYLVLLLTYSKTKPTKLPFPCDALQFHTTPFVYGDIYDDIIIAKVASSSVGCFATYLPNYSFTSSHSLCQSLHNIHKDWNSVLKYVSCRCALYTVLSTRS
jgi:hypothetical protein